jgi:hypothetical protein
MRVGFLFGLSPFYFAKGEGNNQSGSNSSQTRRRAPRVKPLFASAFVFPSLNLFWFEWVCGKRGEKHRPATRTHTRTHTHTKQTHPATHAPTRTSTRTTTTAGDKQDKQLCTCIMRFQALHHPYPSPMWWTGAGAQLFVEWSGAHNGV